jgi:hypothetical protein
MAEHCCTTTKDGLTACTTTNTESKCGCSAPSALAGETSVRSDHHEPHQRLETADGANRMSGALLIGVACLTSPCCVPLIAPVILALLAGTPFAAWLTVHKGWLYGGLTLISMISLAVGWRLIARKTRSMGRLNGPWFRQAQERS